MKTLESLEFYVVYNVQQDKFYPAGFSKLSKSGKVWTKFGFLKNALRNVSRRIKSGEPELINSLVVKINGNTGFEVLGTVEEIWSKMNKGDKL